MRGSRECDQVYCFIVSGCFQWARMRAGYANQKRCIIVDAEYRHRPSEVPWRSGRNIFIIYYFFFDIRVSVLHACTGPSPPVFFFTGYTAPILYDEVRSWNKRCRTVLNLMKGPY